MERSCKDKRNLALLFVKFILFFSVTKNFCRDACVIAGSSQTSFRGLNNAGRFTYDLPLSKATECVRKNAEIIE